MFANLTGRQARPASVAWNLGKTFVQVCVFWSLFLGVLPLAIVRLEYAWGITAWHGESPELQVAGGLLFLGAGTLGLASAWVMTTVGRGTPLPVDCPRRMVIVGPYRYVRNPMALAGISQGVAVGMLLGSGPVVLYSLAGALVWNYLIRPWEERDLERRFGGEFRAYRNAVRCWWPNFGRSRVRPSRARNAHQTRHTRPPGADAPRLNDMQGVPN